MDIQAARVPLGTGVSATAKNGGDTVSVTNIEEHAPEYYP